METQACPYCCEQIKAEAVKCRYCGSVLTERVPRGGGPFAQPITRSSVDRMIAGVCGGIAGWLQIDPTFIRIVWVLVTCFSAIVPGVVAYLLLWIVIPKEP